MPRPLTIVGGRSKKAVSPIWIYTGLVIAVFVVYYRLTDFGASDRRKIYFQGQTGGNSIANGDQCLLPQGNWANTCEESLVIEGPCQGHCLLKATCEQHAGSSVQTSFEYPAGVMLEIKNINGVLCQKVGEVTNCGLNYHRSLQTCPQGVIPMRTIENSHSKGKKFEQDFGDDMDNLISSDEDNGKKKSKFDDDEWEAYFAANKHRSLDDDERPKKAHKDFLPDDFEGNDYGEQHRKKSKRGHHEDDDSSESSESRFGSNRDNHKYRQMATEDDERERKYRQMSNDDDRSERERDHGRERGQRGTDRTRDRDYEHEARDKDWQRDDDSNRDRDYDRDYERRDRDRNRDHDRNYDRDLDHHDRDRDHDEEEPHRRGVIEHDRDHESGGRKGKHAESDEDDGGDWRRKRHRDEEDRDKHLRGWNDRNRY